MYNVVLVTEVWLFWDVKHDYNKCIGDDTKAAARQSLNCINTKKLNMAKNDFQYGGWNSYSLQCGTMMTLISPGDCTLQSGMWLWNRDSELTKWQHPAGLQCDTWLWDDMPLNSPKRPLYWNFTSGFDFDQITAVDVILHQCLKFYPNRTTLGRKKLRHVDFQDGGSQPSWILGSQ